MRKPHLRFEKELAAEGFRLIAGVDEVGRGAWAGPLVAAAVILPLQVKKLMRLGLRDSKQLSSEQREELFGELVQLKIDFGIGMVEVLELDQLGLGQSTRLAMQRAVNSLNNRPSFVLVDGRQIKFPEIPTRGIVGGDALSLSIAAASVVAKVTRDRLMIEIGKKSYPAYGFEIHKGYGTKLHQKKLSQLGICDWHRQSFRPIKFLSQEALRA